MLRRRRLQGLSSRCEHTVPLSTMSGTAAARVRRSHATNSAAAASLAKVILYHLRACTAPDSGHSSCIKSLGILSAEAPATPRIRAVPVTTWVLGILECHDAHIVESRRVTRGTTAKQTDSRTQQLDFNEPITGVGLTRWLRARSGDEAMKCPFWGVCYSILPRRRFH